MNKNEIGQLCEELREYNTLCDMRNEIKNTPHWVVVKTPEHECDMVGSLRTGVLALITSRIEEVERHFENIKDVEKECGNDD